MLRHKYVLAATVFAAMMTGLLAVSAWSHDYKAGPLQISHPWSRATPGAAKVGGGYLKITNTGTKPDRLIGGSTAAAERLEFHRSTVADGVASMRPVEGGVEIRPGETVELAPGGVHVMLVNLKQPLKLGERFGATLVFERAGAVTVEFAIQPIGAGSGGPDHQSAHHGGVEEKPQ